MTTTLLPWNCYPAVDRNVLNTRNMDGRSGVLLTLLIIVTILKCGFSTGAHSIQKNGEVSAKQLLNEILDDLRDLTRRDQESNSNNGNNENDNDIVGNARKWLQKYDHELAIRVNHVTHKNWNYVTNLTDENAAIVSRAAVAQEEWYGERVQEAKDFLDHKDVMTDPDMISQLDKWVYCNDVPVAKDKATITAISNLATELESIYGNAEVTKNGKVYKLEPELTELMAKSRDYDELKWAWQAWRDATGPKMKSKFAELVTNMNKAAKDNGLHDVGVSWRRANYGDDNTQPMVDKLYEDILPLYKQLHAFVRHKLVDYYSDYNLDPDDPIPAHILGNMWGQEWQNLDIVVPFPDVDTYDVTDTMVAKGYTPLSMFQLAEEFFVSIGLEPMTDLFWNKSMIVRPDNRPVQCHASAEDFLTDNDFRIKMCTVVDMDYLQTIHHEMGHIEYFMQYRHQPTVYRTGANAAFHEAIGDTIALSVMTPDHLGTIGLLDYKGNPNQKGSNPNKSCFTSDVKCSKQEKRELNQLMAMALQKVAFLPFGYLIDKWRWDVFSGVIPPSEYNTKWWEYRTKYQGLEAPVERTENDFDPGAKYHVPAFVPYIRYFLSYIGQFQFQKALCDAKGYSGPLHHCDIYQSTEAGDLLKSVLREGSSKPWEDVMAQFTGQRQFSTDAIYSYFSPLFDWLKKYNEKNGITVGWGQ